MNDFIELRMSYLESGNLACPPFDVAEVVDEQGTCTLSIQSPPEEFTKAADGRWMKWALVHRAEGSGRFPGFENPNVGYAHWKSFRGRVRHLHRDGSVAVAVIEKTESEIRACRA